MSDFFEKVKVNANKTKDEAVKIGKQVIDKANNVVGQTKLNFAINDAESKIKDIYEEMGKMIYQSHLSDNPVYESLEESCTKIDKLYEEISALKEKMAELKDSVKCTNCGEYNKQDSLFCSKCGSPVTENENSEAKDIDTEDESEDISGTVKKVITIKARKPEETDND